MKTATALLTLALYVENRALRLCTAKEQAARLMPDQHQLYRTRSKQVFISECRRLAAKVK